MREIERKRNRKDEWVSEREREIFVGMNIYIYTYIYIAIKESIYRLCGDRDETSNHIISEYSKLTKREYKTRHDKVIHWKK